MPKTLKEKISKEKFDMIMDMYINQKLSLREIERRTGHAKAALSKMIKNEIGELDQTRFHPKKYSFDEDFFSKVDNELKAYWLGFLYADGSIQTNTYGEQSVKLTLQQKDEEILEKFKEDLNSTYPIRYDKSKHEKNENHQIQVICDYRSQKVVDDLKKLGCVERKSLILNFPDENQVPNNLIHHFIRGYFDGDGSLVWTKTTNTWNINFVGTEKFIKKLYTYFNMGSVYPDSRGENSWYLNIGGKNQVAKVYNFMYKDATRYMQRKYDKFQKFYKLKYSES